MELEDKKKYHQDEILNRINKVNESLFADGFNLKQAWDFWKECILEARTNTILNLFKAGCNDREIANKTGYGKSMVSKTTREYLENK